MALPVLVTREGVHLRAAYRFGCTRAIGAVIGAALVALGLLVDDGAILMIMGGFWCLVSVAAPTAYSVVCPCCGERIKVGHDLITCIFDRCPDLRDGRLGCRCGADVAFGFKR